MTMTASALPPLANYWHQLAYVVEDMDNAVATMSRNFGVSFARSEGQGDPDKVSYKGRPSDVALAMAFAQVRGIEMEIIQPLNSNNIYTDFLSARGPGLHHIGFKLPDMNSYKNYFDLVMADGGKLLMEGRFEGEGAVDFCYIDCAGFGASVIELMHFS